MKKIIVVDDDADMRGIIVDILSSRFQVLSAENGMDGLELIRRERPDLVVLDLLMPKMHGFEVCQKMRQDERLKSIKVLISSSKSYSHDMNAAQLAGADMYLVKPFKIEDLMGKVNALLEEARVETKLRFWGTRGSIPSPGPMTQRYGGNTPCVELRIGETLIIIDGGTGIRELGNSLLKEAQGKPLKAHILVGHLHWDHIQGLPFCVPLYIPRNRFTIYGAHGTTGSFEEALHGQMRPPYFPVSMKEMGAKIDIVELSGGGALELDGAKITTHYLNHPGVTIGFRIESKDRAVCYISDHEPWSKLNNKGEFSDKEDDAVARFVSGSDLLICEAQYTDEEYEIKKSWGHSTFSDVIGLAAKAKAKRLALFHHDPMHTDEMMDRFVAECRAHIEKNRLDLSCFGAQEGMTLAL